MPREFKDGVWITTRLGTTPDSERHVERDDPLFPSFNVLFTGQELELDLEVIAKEHGLTSEEVFLNLHENYGYACIGTGENPKGRKLTDEEITQLKQTLKDGLAAGNLTDDEIANLEQTIKDGLGAEKLTDEQKAARKKAIKDALAAEKIPHILIKGKYMGIEEDTYLCPFNYRTIGLAGVLQSSVIQQLIKIASDHVQDSLLIEVGGRACYVMTSGPNEGCVYAGNVTVVYPNSDGKLPLPVDCYSLFIRNDGSGVTGFTCALNFSKSYKNIQKFADEENGLLQESYTGFLVAPVAPSASGEAKPKKIIMTRATNGYNDFGLETKVELEEAGLKVAIFGTDANIAKINAELADENSEIFQRAKLYKEELAAKNAELVKAGKEPEMVNIWGKIILPEFVKRNEEIYLSLLKSDYDVIIYCDMNKLATAPFMKQFIEPALRLGHDIFTVVINSSAFDPTRTDYVQVLCNLYGKMMIRHTGDFKSPAGQINAPKITVDGLVIDQHHDLTPKQVLQLILDQAPKSEQASVAALTSGLVGTFLGSTQPQQPKQDSSVDSKIESTPASAML